MYYCLLFIVSLYCLLVVPFAYDYYYLPRYVALAIVSLTAGFLYYKQTNFASIKRCPSLIILLLLLVLTSVLGLDPVNSWLGSVRCTGLSTYIFCAILFFVAAASKEQGKIIKCAAYTAIIVSLLAVLQWFDINLVPHEEFRDGMIAYSTMANPNFLASYCVFLLPAPMLLWLQERKRIWLCTSAILFAGLVVSLTRGAWLTLVIVLLYLLIAMLRGKYTRQAMAALFITLAVVFLLLIPTRDAYIIGRAASIPVEIDAGLKSEDEAGANRMYIWKESLKLFPHYWSFGMGPENLRYANIHIPQYELIVDKAHNIIIEMLVTMGIFTFMAFLFFLARVIKIPENDDEEIVFLMVISYLIQALFNIEVVMIMPLFWIILGFSYRSRSAFRL